jgi:Ca-activated chloride channel family protein
MRGASLIVALLFIGQRPVFRSSVELVRIPVSLSRTSDAATSPDQLSAADFSIFEDGIRQSPLLFEHESVAVRVCVLLDISHSMVEPRAARLSTGAYGHLVTLLSPSDEVSVVTFAMSNSVAVTWMSPEKAARTPLRLTSQAGTAIIDAIKTAMRQIDRAKRGRPLILVITDGGDNASVTRLSELVATRRQSEVNIYAFKIAGSPTTTPATVTATGTTINVPAVDVLPQLVGDSGGVIYDIGQEADVPIVAKRFLEDIHQQYTLAYEPTRPLDGKYRQLRVEINAQGYGIRYRGGYLASKQN